MGFKGDIKSVRHMNFENLTVANINADYLSERMYYIH